MALQFPTSPTDGQVYPAAPNSEYIYSVAKGAWLSLPNQEAKTVTSDTAPANPKDGDQWFKTTDGTFYIYVVDPDGGQWVESQAPITANGYYSPNYIINGAFEINQRGFTSTTSSAVYGFDRWKFWTSGGTGTYSAQAFTLGVAPVAGYEAKNFARIVTTGQSGVNDETSLYQPIEGVRTLAGQTATISFWAKAGSGTPKIAIELSQAFGSSGSPSSTVRTYSGQVTLSTSWARYSVTVSIPSISGKTLGTAGDDVLTVNFFVSAGSNLNSRTGSLGIQNNTFDIWGAQLEEGSIATTFRRNANSLQGELAACQRYYWRQASGTSAYTAFANGFVRSAYNAELYVVFPVSMRVKPTSFESSSLSLIGLAGPGSSGSVTSLAMDSATASDAGAIINAGSGPSLTVGTGQSLLAANSTSAYIAFSAEL